MEHPVYPGENADVYGNSATGDGVRGISTSSQHAGVAGINDSGGFGVWARGKPGGHFESASGDGVFGTSTSSQHAAVSAINDSGGFGVWARGKTAGHFEGDVEVTGDISSLNGNISLQNGDILLSNGDCAEDFAIAGSEKVAPGTVMVIDHEGTLRPSEKAYDKRVAGVVSGAGDYRPAIILDKQISSENRLPIALVGKVYCKVDARYAPIEVGDLLTTSPTSGYAMKADNPLSAFGSVIGKALRPLQDGQGLIPILIALQ